jgi:hypothetical protein
MVSLTGNHGRILAFIDRSRYFLSSSSLIVLTGDLVPDPLLLRKFGSAGNRTRAFGSIARNSDH